MKTKKQISSVSMNGVDIGTIHSDTSPGSTPWGLSYTTNAIITLCSDRGLRMIGNRFEVTFPSGQKWGWQPRG